jgi:DNA-binding FadR family transcriptional regulator
MNQKRKFSKPLRKQTLAEQVAEAIRESILAGEWQGGEALPTEPELAEQFEVSRAVVRDATRMLAAQGLVEAQHGRGVFVTESQVDAFGDALLLALRRMGASVWDVEHFEQILFPEVCALASAEATDEEITRIQLLVGRQIEASIDTTRRYWGREGGWPDAEKERLRTGFQELNRAIFSATHNRVLELLAPPLGSLRNLRYWQSEAETMEGVIESESAYYRILGEAIASGDPAEARRAVSKLMKLPAEAEEAMRDTPVGEVPVIPLALEDLDLGAPRSDGDAV